MYYVYFLLLNNGKIYTGSTNNLKRRLLEHQHGLSRYTKDYLPLKLISFITVATEIKARELEKYFKVGSGHAILKKRILTNEAILIENLL